MFLLMYPGSLSVLCHGQQQGKGEGYADESGEKQSRERALYPRWETGVEELPERGVASAADGAGRDA